MAKINIEIKDEKLVFDAYLSKYPMPDAFKSPEDWMKERIRRKIKMIVQEYAETNATDKAKKEIDDILRAAKDSANVKDDITA